MEYTIAEYNSNGDPFDQWWDEEREDDFCDHDIMDDQDDQ